MPVTDQPGKAARADATPGADHIPALDQLRAAIDGAYCVFAPYARLFLAAVCTCPVCFIPADRQALLTRPLRQIDGGLLDQYSWSAHGADDDGPLSHDLRYLLPRYFELFAANDPLLHRSPEANLRQLGRTAWRSAWPAAEVAAVEEYFRSLLVASLSNDSIVRNGAMSARSAFRCALRIEPVLAMSVLAGLDVRWLIAIWQAAPDPSAVLHMAGLRLDLTDFNDGDGARLRNHFLVADHADAARALAAFVTSAEATRRMEAAFFRTTDAAEQQMLSDAIAQS